MKIAFVSNSKSIHIVRWANAFARRGNEVFVISCANDIGANRDLYADTVKIVPLKYATPIGYYLNAYQLKNIVKKEQFDVVNVHYASGYGTLGRKAGLKHALLNIWGSDVYEFPYESRMKYNLMKKNLSYYMKVASTSNCMARQAGKIVNRNYHITPFGVDIEKFTNIPDIKPKDMIVFGTVKTLLPKYGISDTIKAFSKLVNRLSNEGRIDIIDKLVYEIYGQGDQQFELQQLIDDIGMANKIKLCGYVPNNELPKIYNRFTVFNSNSKNNSESFGVAAVEAMACGIPVQVSDADGFVEVVDNGVTGLIAAKGDIESISNNMYLMLMDNEMRQRMGICGVERVRRLYDWNNNVDEMERLYREVIECTL